MNPVRVTWMDSRQIFEDWTLLNGGVVLPPADELEVTSVGFLFVEDDDMIVLVQNAGDDQVLGGVAIPKASILQIEHLA